MHRTLGVNEIAHPPKLAPQHLLVQEQQGSQGLVLCRGRDLGLGGERRKKGPNFELAHGLWMALAVEDNEPPNPADIGFLGAHAVVERPQPYPNAIEQANVSPERRPAEIIGPGKRNHASSRP